MDTLIPVIYKILPLYLFITLGFVAGKRLQIDKESIAKLLIYVIVPIIIFHGAFSADPTVGLFMVPVTFFILASAICLVTFKIAKHFWSDATPNLLAFGAGTGNTGYFGIPVAVALFGEQSLSFVVFATLGMVLYENTVGFYVTARGHHTPREAIQKILRLPTIYAFLAGLLLHAFFTSTSPVYLDTITLFRGAYSTLGMMLIGLALAQVSIKQIDWRFTTVSLLIKFLAWPALMLGVLWLDGLTLQLFSNEVRAVMLLMTLTPQAVNTISYATVLRTHPEKAAVCVAASTLLALVTIPLTLSWLGLI